MGFTPPGAPFAIGARVSHPRTEAANTVDPALFNRTALVKPLGGAQDNAARVALISSIGQQPQAVCPIHKISGLASHLHRFHPPREILPEQDADVFCE